MSKECVDNRQELLAGMMYWSKTNGIEIDTAVFFVKMAIEEMVKKKFNLGGPMEIYDSVESGISLLMVIPRTTQEIEEEIRRKRQKLNHRGQEHKRRYSRRKKQIQGAHQEIGTS